MTTTRTSPAQESDQKLIERVANLRAAAEPSVPQQPQHLRAGSNRKRSQVKLCTKCGELYAAAATSCPGCEPTAAESESRPKSEQHGQQREAEERQRPKPRFGSSAWAKLKSPLTKRRSPASGRLPTGRSLVASSTNAVRRHRYIFAGIFLTLAAVAAFFFLVIRDPDAVVASSAVDASRPRTAAVLESARTADTLSELAAVGSEAATAKSTSSDGIDAVAGLEDLQYRKAATNDLQSQRQLLAAYAAMGTLNPRRSTSSSIAAIRRQVDSQSSLAAPAIVRSSRQVAAIGALAPQNRRVEIGAARIQAAKRHTIGVLLAAEQKIGAWERRLAAWHASQKARRQNLSSYVAATNGTMDQYAALRTELDSLSANELDLMTLDEAQAALQSHLDRRADLRDQLLSQTPPAGTPAELGASHDRLVASLDDGINGLRDAIGALDESNNVAYGYDLYSGSAEPALFGDSFRDSAAWASYLSTSERNTETLATIRPGWQESAGRAKEDIDGDRAPRRPRL
jgi:hypothetical protein